MLHYSKEAISLWGEGQKSFKTIDLNFAGMEEDSH